MYLGISTNNANRATAVNQMDIVTQDPDGRLSQNQRYIETQTSIATSTDVPIVESSDPKEKFSQESVLYFVPNTNSQSSIRNTSATISQGIIFFKFI